MLQNTMELLIPISSWILHNLQFLLRISWLLATASILIASIPLRPFSALRNLILNAASRGKLNNSSSSKPWTVPQSYFLHFYMVCVTWTAFLLVCISFFAYYTSAPAMSSAEYLGYSSVASHLAGGADSLALARTPSNVAKYSQKAWKTVFVLLLMEAQAVRRLYETVCVFNYGPSARMHVLGYLCGLFFYIAAPLSLCSLCCPDVFSYIVTQVINSLLRQQANISGIEFKILKYVIPLLKLGWCQWIGAFIFVWGSIHQHRCHKILGSLRMEHQDSNEYFIPHGDWFMFVSCPHYLAEIIIYAGLLIATGGSDRTMWLLFGFVVANLTFAAIETHRWYLRKFDNYPHSRWSIIPFVC